MRKILSIILACMLLILPACSSADKGSDTSSPYYSFTDSMGNQISLREKPQKVAVLFSSLADLWQTAGGEISVTVGEAVDRGIVSDSILLVDEGAGKTINEELLVSYEPDFVIGTSDLEAQASAVKLMSENGTPAAMFTVDNFEDYLSVLKIFTDITGNSEAYQLYGESVKAEINSVKEKCLDQGDTKNILFIRAGSSGDSTKAKTAEENFVCAMLNELGTYNIAENAPVLLDGLSFEEVLSEDPEYIFISTMGKESAAIAYMDSVLAEDTWSALTAVQEGKLYYLPKDLFQYKPNAKWAEAYTYLAELMYPNLF